MARTVTEAFRAFKANLEVTDLQAAALSARQTNVRSAVRQGFTVLDDFLTGSYKRSTMIRPLNEADVDIFFVLDVRHYESAGQARLLDRLKRVLKLTYPSTPEISRDGQAVTITFSDFEVDVVPGFRRMGGGYLIPSTYGGGRWVETDPKAHVSLSSAHNASHNGDLVPVIKMLKRWNKEIGGFFRSFHLEVLAWQVFEDVRISSYSSGARWFFDKARGKMAYQLRDPAGYGGDVAYYISGRLIDEAKSRLQTAYGRALKAESYELQGRHDLAITEWQKVFGVTYFPGYG